MHDRLRLFPECARRSQHFIFHQSRPFAHCPLHSLLYVICHRCRVPLAYVLRSCRVFGPINCPACQETQLPLSVSYRLSGGPVLPYPHAVTVKNFKYNFPVTAIDSTVWSLVRSHASIIGMSLFVVSLYKPFSYIFLGFLWSRLDFHLALAQGFPPEAESTAVALAEQQYGIRADIPVGDDAHSLNLY